MECIVIHDGKQYSMKEFKDLLLTDSSLYEILVDAYKKSIAAIIERTKDYPELLAEGNVFQLQAIAANSKIDVINYPNDLTLQVVEDYKEARNIAEVPFSDVDKYTIMQEVIARTFSTLDITSNATNQEIYKAAETIYDEIVQTLYAENKIREARFMEDMADEILGREMYEDSIREYINAELDITEDEDILDQTGENIKDVGQASYEVDITKALSTKVKLMLSAIKDETSEPGFAGFRNNLTGKDALDAIQQILSESANNSIENLEEIIALKVQQNPKDLAFYKQIGDVLNTLKETNPDILNQVLYNLYQAKVQMRFIMYRQGEGGRITIENYDANVKNPLFIKRNKWGENLKISGLIQQYESVYYKVDEVGYKRAKELFDSVTKAYDLTSEIKSVPRADFVELLKLYGISLNTKTLDNMYDGIEQNGLDLVKQIIGNKKSAIRIIQNNLETAYKSEAPLALSVSAKKVNSNVVVLDILNKSNSQLNDIIRADNAVEFLPMGTMYIAGKTINMYQQPNPISNKVRKLKTALVEWDAILNDDSIPDIEKPTYMPETLERFISSKVTSNSILLNMLLENPLEASKYFDTFSMSLEALKEGGTKSREDMGITNLSDRDAIITLLGMFSNSEGSFVSEKYAEEYNDQITFRKGYMNFPTLSDSSQMPLLKTIMISLQEHNLDESGNLDEHMLDLLRDQLVFGDANRIVDYYQKIKGTSNIMGYDAGATWLTGMSSLNTVLVDVEIKGVPVKRTLKRALRDLVENSEKTLTEEDVKLFLDNNKEAINSAIQKNIDYEVGRFINEDGTAGLLVKEDLVKNGKLVFDDNKKEGYYNGKSARFIMYDYVINNFVQQKEIQNLFAGDMAFYFKDKMSNDLKHDLPKVTFTDISNFYYPGAGDTISKLLGDRNISELTQEEIDNLKPVLQEDFPLLLLSDEFLDENSLPAQEHYEALAEVVNIKVNKIFKDVQNNLSKRLKGQLSPGNQFADVANISDTYQIMLSDVETASETIEEMVARAYPDIYQDIKNDLRAFKLLDEKEFLDTEADKVKYKELHKSLSKKIPNLAAYLKTTSTDAQEYTSWSNNLEQLYVQGRLTLVQRENIKRKLIAQTEDLANGNTIKEENRLTREEMSIALMQPSKPLYSGLVDQDIQGHRIQRYVYIKSSSFPLIPELTVMFPKLNNMRKVMETIEKRAADKNSPVTVRMAYESAVKVGAPKNLISVKKLQQDINDEKDMDNLLAQVEESSVILPKENFYIQQDKPFKADKNLKKNKPDRTVRATQFEKIILGDEINKMGSIFPAISFDLTLLTELDIKVDKNGNISGPDLKKVYDNVYKREQELLHEKLFSDLGINSYEDIANGNVVAMEQLVRQLNKRLNNKQDKKALELLYKTVNEKGITEFVTKRELAERGLTAEKAIFRMPLMMTPNSRKFESVLNSMINKNSINLDLPGFSFPVASQEGFDYRGFSEDSYKDLKNKGLIVTPNFDPSIGLRSERDAATGELKHAQVFIASKYKVLNTDTGKYEWLDLTKFVDENNVIDTKKFPQDLLSMFSFRIPTSRHQSGAVIEVAGFLPHSMGDLCIVPKDHTVQIGEDYDIDVRYAYQYNYMLDKVGNLKKMEYSDLVDKPEKTLGQLNEELKEAKDNLWNSYFKEESNVDQSDVVNGNNFQTVLRNPLFELNKETIMEIIYIQDAIDGHKVDNFLKDLLQDKYDHEVVDLDTLKETLKTLEASIIPKSIVAEKRQELLEEYRELKKGLIEATKTKKDTVRPIWEEYYHAKSQKANEVKVLENNLVAMYKSVFSSPNEEVRNMITSVLSTDFSEKSAEMIDAKLSEQEPYFNIHSPLTQRNVMKLGADGKMGIGVHSNAVTLHSLLQQLDTPLQFYAYKDPETGKVYPYNIILGDMTFDGRLGKIKDDRNRRISEYLSESQNSATDNQKLEIMGRRNENSETISVFSLMQMSGLEDDGLLIKGQSVSYASLFISQPVLLKYVDTVKKYKSSTVNLFGSPSKNAFEEIFKGLADQISDDVWEKDALGNPITGKFKKGVIEEVGKSLTSVKLYDSIRPLDQFESANPVEQYYILQAFQQMMKPSESLRELQSFVNIESGGMGVSYFDTIALKDFVEKIDDLPITSQDHIKGKVVEDSLTKLMFGDLKKVPNTEADTTDLKDYVFLYDKGDSKVYIKPTNHYSHKIMNSIGAGYNLWNSIFPYDDPVYHNQIEAILKNAGIKPGTKKATELQYDIISNMKDYSYTSSQTLFGKDFEAERDRIFFDDRETGQESLGSYIQRIRNYPDYTDMFRQPFFRDLQVEINDKSHPTIIKYVSGDMSTINNLKMYNLLEKMINSNKSLPPKADGTPVTEADLMKELLMYSLVADQGNGAIGFRHLLPMSLFSKYQIDTILRNRNNVNSTKDALRTNLIYSGTNATVENFLGSKVSNRGIIQNNLNHSVEDVQNFIYNTINKRAYIQTGKKDAYKVLSDGSVVQPDFQGESNQVDFVRQYLQHNPDKIGKNYGYSSSPNSNYYKLMESNLFSDSELAEGEVTHLTVNTTKENLPTYFTVTDMNGKVHIYERYDKAVNSETEEERSYYRSIPKLGIFGFNEYQISSTVNSSKVSVNNVSAVDYTRRGIQVDKIETIFKHGNANDLVDTLLEGNAPYAPLVKALQQFVDNWDNIEINIVENIPGSAQYIPASQNGGIPVININKKVYTNSKNSQAHLQKKIAEELLHHVTVTTVNEFVTFKGIDDNGNLDYEFKEGTTAPAPLKTLITVYSQAIKHYADKHGMEKLQTNFNSIKSIKNGTASGNISFSEQSQQDAYRIHDFHEFIAGIFIKDEHFAQEMANTPYLESGKSILQKFAETLMNFFSRLLPNNKKDTFSAAAANNLFKFLEEYSVIKGKENPLRTQATKKSYLEYMQELEKANKAVKDNNANNKAPIKVKNNKPADSSKTPHPTQVSFDPEMDSDINANREGFTKTLWTEDYKTYGNVYSKSLGDSFNIPGLDAHFALLPDGIIIIDANTGYLLGYAPNTVSDSPVDVLNAALDDVDNNLAPETIESIINAPKVATIERVDPERVALERLKKAEDLGYHTTKTEGKYNVIHKGKKLSENGYDTAQELLKLIETHYRQELAENKKVSDAVEQTDADIDHEEVAKSAKISLEDLFAPNDISLPEPVTSVKYKC